MWMQLPSQRKVCSNNAEKELLNRQPNPTPRYLCIPEVSSGFHGTDDCHLNSTGWMTIIRLGCGFSGEVYRFNKKYWEFNDMLLEEMNQRLNLGASPQQSLMGRYTEEKSLESQ
jgi:hypothetical protein